VHGIRSARSWNLQSEATREFPRPEPACAHSISPRRRRQERRANLVRPPRWFYSGGRCRPPIPPTPAGRTKPEGSSRVSPRNTLTSGVARFGRIDRSNREVPSPLDACLYACHHRLVNRYSPRDRSSHPPKPDSEASDGFGVAEDATNAAQFRPQFGSEATDRFRPRARGPARPLPALVRSTRPSPRPSTSSPRLATEAGLARVPAVYWGPGGATGNRRTWGNERGWALF
jgi:hypothetical protein